MKHLTYFLILALTCTGCFGQIRINLIQLQENLSSIEIKNFGNSSTDISNYWISANLNNYEISSFSINTINADLILDPNESISINTSDIIRCWNGTNSTDISLYKSNNFSSPNDMVDFFQFGNGGQGREAIAVAKGIWGEGEFKREYCAPGSGNIMNLTFFYIGNGTQYGVSYWSHGALSIEEEELNQIELTPNPAKNTVQLINSNGVRIDQIHIHDVTGKLISTYKAKKTINISHLKSGIYMVTLQSERHKTVKRLVVL